MARAISLTDAEVCKVLSILTGRRRSTKRCGGFFKRQHPNNDPKRLPDDSVVAQALAILAGRIRSTDTLSGPAAVRDYLKLLLGGREHEVFVVLLLDAQNRLLHSAELFRGTLTQTSVYPREVVKLALATNAAAVIFAHNHPSGVSEPSRADELLTSQLKSALAVVDIKVLDHFIVAGAAAMSFTERGLL
jgi:DNA repair protein RadC